MSTFTRGGLAAAARSFCSCSPRRGEIITAKPPGVPSLTPSTPFASYGTRPQASWSGASIASGLLVIDETTPSAPRFHAASRTTAASPPEASTTRPFTSRPA
jgi:hypothetical protein